MNTTDFLAHLCRQGPTCPECGRRFDLLDQTDADEWAHGHECEGELNSNDDILSMILADHEGWEHDGYGLDGNLICPCGDMIELDGECPQGCVSPLIEMGMI